jgi:hypothetical protein
LSTGCLEALTVATGDRFIVHVGGTIDINGCKGNRLEGDRPSFVPPEYGSCSGNNLIALECKRRSAKYCLPIVRFELPDYEAGGRQQMTVVSMQCTLHSNGCDAACADGYGICRERYAVTVARLD